MDNQPPFPGQGPGGLPGMPGLPGSMPGSPSPLGGDWMQQRPTAEPEEGKKKRGKRSKGKDAATDKPEGPTRKVVSTQRLAALGLAAVAGLLFLLTSGADPGDTTFVVRAERGLSALELVDEASVAAITMPTEFVEQGAFTGPSAEQAIADFLAAHGGSRLQYPVAAGRQITPELFVLAGLVELAEDERLVSVDASIARAVGGKLRVGDRIDVIGVGEGVSSILVSDVEVIGVTLSEENYGNVVNDQTSEDGRDRTVDELLPGDPVPGTYTLRVKTLDAARLAAVDRNSSAELVLVYRAPGAETLVTGPTSLMDVLCGLDQPGRDAKYLNALPAECRNLDGKVEYSGGTVTETVPSLGSFAPQDDPTEGLFVPEG
jgi:Flp pilus assembly protein CpaB